jgi:hypothetical protein
MNNIEDPKLVGWIGHEERSSKPGSNRFNGVIKAWNASQIDITTEHSNLRAFSRRVHTYFKWTGRPPSNYDYHDSWMKRGKSVTTGIFFSIYHTTPCSPLLVAASLSVQPPGPLRTFFFNTFLWSPEEVRPICSLSASWRTQILIHINNQIWNNERPWRVLNPSASAYLS